MKNLTALIRTELEVPDDWALAEHASGIVVSKVGDQFVDFDLAPLATDTDAPEAEWTDRNANLVDTVLETVGGSPGRRYLGGTREVENRIACILFARDGKNMILLHGFIKKQQATPKPDLDLARERLKQLRRR
jgi:hypothetical protein